MRDRGWGGVAGPMVASQLGCRGVWMTGACVCGHITRSGRDLHTKAVGESGGDDLVAAVG